MTADDDLVEDMLAQWDEIRSQGRAVTPEELCRDHPHLLPELVRQVDALRAMSWVDGPG